METYLKIAQLYLEDEDPVQAEAYINRASLLQTDTKTEKLQILYKVHAHSSNIKQYIWEWLDNQSVTCFYCLAVILSNDIKMRSDVVYSC